MKTVLLAYEREQDLAAVETVLQSRGHRVVKARTGVEALDAIRRLVSVAAGRLDRHARRRGQDRMDAWFHMYNALVVASALEAAAKSSTQRISRTARSSRSG